MSIASEITRINNNIAAAYTALDGKGATLPAEGSQNSANLADTIDTITTGGGGGASAEREDFRADEFNAQVTEMRAYPDSDFSVANLIANQGWSELPNTSYLSYNVVYTVLYEFTTEITTLKMLNAWACAIKLPSTATISEKAQSAWEWTITFNGDERWVMLAYSATPNSFLYAIGTSDTDAVCFKPVTYEGSSSWTSSINRGWVVGAYTKHKSTYVCTSSSGKLFESYDYSKAKLLCAVDADAKVDMSSFVSYGLFGQVPYAFTYFLQQVSSTPNPENFLKCINDYNGTDEFYAFSSSFTNQYLMYGSTCPEGNSATDLAYRVKKFPFVIDLSGSTGTNAWKFYKTWTSISAAPLCQWEQARIKLPSTHTPVQLEFAPYLDLASWQYIAQNAPTVTSKTLYVAYPTLLKMRTGSSDWRTVYTTLLGKGWSISGNG